MSEKAGDRGESLRQILRFSRIVKELKAKIKNETQERIEDKLRRWQQLQTPDLPEAIQAVRAWNPAWAVLFSDEKARLVEALGADRVSTVEHFGSTAIPHLASKSILDLIVALSGAPVLEQRECLAALGYHHYGVSPCDPDAHWFWNTESSHHAFVAHVCQHTNPWLQTALGFRHYMCAHPAECQRYEDLKRSLKAERERSLLEYSAKKLLLFYEVSEKARVWRMAQLQA